jgi:perosamine synthetase
MAGALAIRGGERVVPEGMALAWPPIEEEDVQAVAESLRSGIIWGQSAPQMQALRREWCDYLGVKHCAVFNSGSAALHACLAGVGVEAGDEVIVPAYSFYSTATPVVHQNAIPIFVDIDRRAYNIDPSRIEAAITEKTKAIVAVHLWGLPADMDEIREVARRHNLTLIEDAAQAHGATYGGKKAGTLGDAAAFSQNGSKNLPGGEGGFFVTDSPEIYERGARLEMCVTVVDGVRSYPTYSLGYNYRGQEMTCALTRSFLRKLDPLNALRAANCEYLTRELGAIPGVVVPHVPEDRTSVYHMYRVQFDPQAAGLDMPLREFRDRVERALEAEGVSVGQWVDRLLPEHGVYQAMDAYGKGCPWSCRHARAGITYDVSRLEEDYPNGKWLVDGGTILWNTHPPNGLDLMGLFVEGFRKVFTNLDQI